MLTESDGIDQARNTISVKITYDYNLDEFIIESEFTKPEQTLKCIQLGLEKFLDDVTILQCPECGYECESRWLACPQCGKDL